MLCELTRNLVLPVAAPVGEVVAEGAVDVQVDLPQVERVEAREEARPLVDARLGGDLGVRVEEPAPDGVAHRVGNAFEDARAQLVAVAAALLVLGGPVLEHLQPLFLAQLLHAVALQLGVRERGGQLVLVDEAVAVGPLRVLLAVQRPVMNYLLIIIT